MTGSRETDAAAVPARSGAVEDWRRRLRAHGYRITPQRQLVLAAVNRLKHASPEQILSEVQLTAPNVNLSTVYRTLDVLESVRLVTHAHIEHRAPTYHSVDDRPHIHLVCDHCHEVQGVPGAIAEPLSAALQQDWGFGLEVGHIALHGRCADCAGSAESLAAAVEPGRPGAGAVESG